MTFSWIQCVLMADALRCGIHGFLCASDRCKRIQIYIHAAVQMGLNIYTTASAWGYLCHGMYFKRVEQVHAGRNQMQLVRSETVGGVDVQ